MTTPAGLVKVRGLRRGAGWRVGAHGVLTAAHVGGRTEGDHCLVVPHAVRGAETYDARVVWSDPDLDLCLLLVTDPVRWEQLEIAHERTVLAEVGAEPVEAVAIGFPDDSLVSGFPSPSTVVGTVLPAEHLVAGRVPLDARTATPDRPSAWAGMSGAAVRDAAGRLLGVVTHVSTAHQNRRLLVSPLPPAAPEGAFVAALATVGANGVVEDARAALARALLVLCDEAGRPPLVSELPLRALGVRRARTDIELHGNDYFPYIPRQVDVSLDDALARRADGSDPRPLLVVGESMAGTSRSVSEAVRRHAPWQDAILLQPRSSQDLALVLATWTGRPAVLWLEDTAARSVDHAAVRSLTTSGQLVGIVVLSAEELRRLQGPPPVGTVWRVLTDEALVERVRVEPELNHPAEQTALEESGIVKAVAQHNYRLAEYLGAGDELLLRLEFAPVIGRALFDLVADWRLTGAPINPGGETVASLWPHYYAAATGVDLDDCDDDELRGELKSALAWATVRVAGTRSVLLRRRGALIPDPYVLTRRAGDPDHGYGPEGRTALASLWNEAIRETAALPHPPADLLAYVALMGGIRGADPQLQREATRRAASLGSGAACLLEGASAFRHGDPSAARRWWEAAVTSSSDASTAHVGSAHLLLGMAVTDLEPADKQRHLEAAAAAGHRAAAAQLGVELMSRGDPAALHWLEEAADEHGDDVALFLGILLTRHPDRLDDAERWLRRAATAGQLVANVYLAELLVRDPGRAEAVNELVRALLQDPQMRLVFTEEAVRAGTVELPGKFFLQFSVQSHLKAFLENATILLE